MTDLFEQRLRNALASLPAPDAPRSIIDRVLAERAAGARIVLPVDTLVSRWRRAFRGIAPTPATAIAVAAAIIVIIGASMMVRGVRRSPSLTAADSVSSIERFFISSGVAPSVAYAQTPPPSPGAPPISGLNGLSLGGRTFEYRIQFVDTSGRVTPDGDGSVRISDARFEGRPAWRVDHVATTRGDDGQVRVESETLYVTQRDLRPLARVVHQVPYRRFSQITIHQRFVGDSVLGVMSTDNGVQRPIARLLPPTFGPYLSDALAPVALVGLPLGPRWRASLSIVGWAVIPTDIYFPVTLRVVGEEVLTTSAGVFACWKVRVSAGSELRLELVRKSDGIALRSVDEVVTAGKGRREFLLLNP